MLIKSVSETKARLSALLDRVKAGETVTITDRGLAVAQLVPLAGATGVDREARLGRLARAGLVRLPTRTLEPGWLAEQPLPAFEESALEALLEERRESAR